MSKAFLPELRRLAALGYTTKEAAQTTGCSWSSVRTYDVRYGLHFISEADLRAARVLELASSGRTALEIAADVGCDKTHVYRVLAREPDAPKPLTKAQRAQQEKEAARRAEEAERMARWREAWARKKAEAAVATPTSRLLDEASLGEAMRRQAQAEGRRRRA